MKDLLSEDSLRQGGLFRPETVSRLIREHESRLQNHSHLLWALMVFELWKARFLSPRGTLSAAAPPGEPA